jgi:hypothetical protein
MLTPKNNIKQKISAAMDKMREKKVARLEKKVDKVKGKMAPKTFNAPMEMRKKETKTYYQNKGMDTMSKAKEGFDKIKGGMKNY